MVELEVDTRVEEGWVEEVRYIEGKKYQRYNDTNSPKTWSLAEEDCKSKGSHLASVLTSDDFTQMVINYTDSLNHPLTAWIGGNDLEEEGVWRNTDGTPWGFEKWWSTYYGNRGDQENCININDNRGMWENICSKKRSYWICNPKYIALKDKMIQTKQYTAKDLSFTNITVRYIYQAADQQLLDSWQDKRMTGFKLSWFISNMEGITNPSTEQTVVSNTSLDTGKAQTSYETTTETTFTTSNVTQDKKYIEKNKFDVII